MISIPIKDLKGKIKKLSLHEIVLFLEQKLKIKSKTDIDSILEKISTYTNILLMADQKSISSEQFATLIESICQERQIPYNNIHTHIQVLLKTNQTQNSDLEITPLYKEKYRLLYASSQDTDMEHDQLINLISSKAHNKHDAAHITTLLKKQKLLFHQNILRKHNIDNCYINVEDKLQNIFETLKNTVIFSQSQIGTTIDFSHIRPKTAIVNSTGNKASGPVSFIKIFTSSLEAFRQNNQLDQSIQQKFILSVDHPDILEYLIFIKDFHHSPLNKYVQFFINLTPAFIDSLFKNDEYELYNPQNGKVLNLLKAKNTFDLIVSTLLENSQLGLSVDQASENHFTVSATINLNLYSNDKDFKQLSKDIKLIEKYLQAEEISLPLNHANFLKKVVINFNGWGNYLINKKIAYHSLAAIEEAKRLLSMLKEVVSPDTTLSSKVNSPLNNIQKNTIGIEPLEEIIVKKTSLNGIENFEINGILEELFIKEGLNEKINLHQLYLDQSLLNLNLPEQIKQLFVTSSDINADFHVQMQKTFEELMPNGTFEKKIVIQNAYDLNEVKLLLQKNIKTGIKQLSSFSLQYSKNEEQGYIHKPNYTQFLGTNAKKINRQHRQIQPPLFNIKKTEEISLPPIQNA